jgi:hypothetical protein
MPYVRLFTNALAGGVLVSLYVAVLVLQLNPRVPVVSWTAVRWFGATLSFYAPYATAALFVLLFARNLLGRRPLRPAWLSVRLLAWLSAAGATVAAIVTWANLSAFRGLLTEAAAVRMRDGAWLTSGCAVALVIVAIVRYSFWHRGRRAEGVVMVLLMVLSVGGPIWLRGPGETPVRPPTRWTPPARAAFVPRVHLLLFDGASLGFIRQRVAAGQLGMLARILDRGAAIDLATVRPTQVEPVWVAAATGKFSEKNGIRSASEYRVTESDAEQVDILPDYCFAYAMSSQGFIRARPHTSAALDARTLWDVLTDYGVTVGVSNWPLTYPARARRGYVLSDRFDEAAASPMRLADAGAGDPTTAVEVARETFDRWHDRPWHEVVVPFTQGELPTADINRARWDRAYSDTADQLNQQFAPTFRAIRYEGLETFGHAYFRQAQPESFGDPRWASAVRPVLDRYYAYLDDEVGRVMQTLAPGDLLIVMSGFGMDASSLGKRLLAVMLGERELTGTHESGPDGFLLAYGNQVATGQFPRGSVTDLAPTVLYYMGFPVGRDMDGFPRTDLFLSSFALEHPVKYVASHEK